MSERISLKEEHLLRDIDVKGIVAAQVRLVVDHWMVLDRIRLANNDYIEGIRSGSIEANAHILNGVKINQEQADAISPSVGKMHRDLENSAKEHWEEMFAKSQNWLRLSSLAQTFLIWEENIRLKYLELVDFEHSEIELEKASSCIQANAFGDLRLIRHSLWHADSGTGELGIFLFPEGKVQELGRFMPLTEGSPMVVPHGAISDLGDHIIQRVSDFPKSFYLARDERKST